MEYLSKHYVGDGANQLVLDPEDWTPEQFDAFMKIFGLTEATKIIINEYRIETYAESKVGEGDWIIACDHLNMLIAEYVAAGWVGQFALQTTLLPLKKRYDSGERSQSLYDEIMACE